MATQDTPNILNVTLPLKQDAASQAKLQAIAAQFATDLMPKVMAVLGDSKMVHYCRFVLIDNKYLQILTEYDTPFDVYTDFFTAKLHDFFGLLFSVVEGAPDASRANDRATIHKFVKDFDLPCFGGKAFSAYGNHTVLEIQKKFGLA